MTKDMETETWITDNCINIWYLPTYRNGFPCGVCGTEVANKLLKDFSTDEALCWTCAVEKYGQDGVPANKNYSRKEEYCNEV